MSSATGVSARGNDLGGHHVVDMPLLHGSSTSVSSLPEPRDSTSNMSA
jgi:hypothetical protein